MIKTEVIKQRQKTTIELSLFMIRSFIYTCRNAKLLKTTQTCCVVTLVAPFFELPKYQGCISFSQHGMRLRGL